MLLLPFSFHRSLAVLLLAGAFLTERTAAQPIPTGGVPLVAATDLATEGSFYTGETPGGPVATRTVIAVDGQPFARGARFDVPRPTGEFWSSAVVSPSTRAVADGDVVLLHFFLRAVQTTDESGTVAVQVYAEGPGPAFTKSLSQQASAATDWVEYFLPFEVEGNHAAGEFGIKFGFGAGDRPRTLDLAGVEVLWYGRTRALAELPRTAFSYDGRAADAPWRAAAAARIDQYRKANYAVRVRDAAGQAVPGADVRVRLRRHAFAFGTAFVAARVADLVAETNATYRQKLLETFNAGSPENDLKWPAWAGEWGEAFNRRQTLEALDWLLAREFQLRGHVLVWPSARNLPRSLEPLLAARDPTVPARVLAHLGDVIGATQRRLVEWDVLNEPFDNHELMDLYGDGVMVDWFREARRLHPDAKLFINDYGILSGGGINAAHQDAYEATIRWLLAHGAPVDGIGLQGHFEASPTGIPRVWSLLQRYATAFPGLALKVTEFDFDTDDEQLQADYTRDLLTLVFSHPAVTGFQTWGFWEGAMAVPRAAMYREDWTEKPNGAAFRELVHGAWRTDATHRTDAAGRASGRGFPGAYDVAVTLGGRTMTAGFDLPPGGADVEIVFQPAADAGRLVNLATRGPVAGGAQVMIAGFVLRGAGRKDLLIRGIGPRLETFGVPGTLANPRLEVLRSGEAIPVARNDDWDPALATAFGQVGAFDLAGDTRSAALRVALPPGIYTAQLSGVGGDAGVGIVEVYDLGGDDPIEAVNLSTRGLVGAGAELMVGGVTVRGAAQRVLIRGVGPGLVPFGVAGALADPVCVVLKARGDGTGGADEIARNDQWESGGAAERAELVAAATQAGAFALEPGSRDAALLLTLAPGSYTVQLTGANGGTGVGMIEVYTLD